MNEPSWRTPFGVFAIIAWIVLWVVAIASLSGSVGGWPVLAQALFYLVAGLAWIVPLKPVLQWIETGRFKP
jgi:hypothetical protein